MEKEKAISINWDDIKTKVTELLPAWFEKELLCDYSSPIKKAIEQEISNNQGVINQMVKEIISDIIVNEEFKKKLGEEVIKKIITSSLK